MKKTALLLAAFAAMVCVGVKAQDSTSSYSVTTDFAYTSKYVFRGVQQSPDAFQPSVEVSAENAYLGLWTSQPITRHYNNEVDIYGGYKYKFNEQLSFEGVGTYYWYPEAHASLGQTKHSYEAGLGATYTLYGVATTVYYYYDFRLHTNTLQGSVGYSIPIKEIGSSFDLSAFYGLAHTSDALPDAAGPRIHDGSSYYGFDVAIPYKLTDKATLSPAFHWADDANNVLDTNRNKFWVSISLSVGF
jgi:uncharacterized protein (TIGR02001 family)